MCRKTSLIVLLAFVSLLCANAQAAVYWTDGSGTNHNWANPDNWDSFAVPTSTDIVWWQYYSPLTPAYINDGDNAVCQSLITRQFQTGVSDVNILIMTGGTLNVGGEVNPGWQFPADASGQAIMRFNGGTASIGNLNYGFQGAAKIIVGGANVTITGGTNLSYGSFRKDLIVTAGLLDVKGYFASSGNLADKVEISGGKLIMGSTVQLSQSSSGQGPLTWMVTGNGEADIANSWLRHYYGAATFTLSGNGIMRVKGDIETGTRANSSVTWNISDNAHLIGGANFYPVEDAGGTAVINMSGGTMNIAGEIGASWGGTTEQITWNLTGGTINCGDIWIYGNSGLVDINGGTVKVAGDKYSSLRTSGGLTQKIISSAGQLIATYDDVNDITVLTSGPTHGQAYWPLPGDHRTGQSILSKLQWIPGNAATSNGHHVYFGTAPGALVDKGLVTDPNFDPGELLPGVTYYWRVDEINGGTTAGDVWSFTTGAAACDNPPLYDLNNDCKVNIGDFALLSSEWLDCGLIPASACGI